LKHTYQTLDAMRGIAAIAVVLYHFGPLLQPFQLAPRGYLAVDFFFVLSGFIVAHAYEARLERGLPFIDFFLIRLIRFYPLYIVGLLIALVKALAQISIGDAQAMDVGGLCATTLLALGFMPSPWGRLGELFPLNVAAWSLFLELAVNAAYAVARPWLSTTVISAILFISGSVLAWEAFHSTAIVGGAFWNDLWIGVLRVSFSFFSGLLLYRKRTFTLSLLPTANSWLLLFFLFGLLIAHIPETLSSWYDLSFILVLSPLLVMLGAKAESKSGVFSYLGIISYPVYVMHQPIATASRQASVMTGIPPVVVAVTIIASLACAAPILVYFFDIPARRWLTTNLVDRRSFRLRAQSSESIQ
jgi:peptidoglycan/LPS O-acetylase OafA/YrhL